MLEQLGPSRMPKMQISDRLALSVKPMGNWRRIWRQDARKMGHCPFFGKELAILSNGAVTFCHLDYDGRTTIGNVAEMPLTQIFEQPVVQKYTEGFMTDRVIPEGCQYCGAVTNTSFG
jgi:radical SAM protein with 4Fe4S-binding SPASM domain